MEKKKKKKINSFMNSVSLQEKINFARNLSVGIKSGIPIGTILGLLTKQTDSKYFVKVINEIIGSVNKGQSFAGALNEFHDIFGDFFISIVKVGESSGNLSESLLYIATELKKQKDTKGKVRSAMIYPMVLLCITLSMTAFLVVFIFPKILPIFTSLKVELPITTRIVIGLLDFLKHYGVISAISLVSFVIGLKFMFRVKKVRFIYHKFLLSLPLISKTITDLTLTNFSRSIGILLKSGMNLVDAISVSSGTFNNLLYKQKMEKLIEYINRGETLSNYLQTEPKYFPPMFIGMIKVGESSGQLEENMFYLAEYYESEVDEQIKNITTLIEPALLLFMGLSVGFIALSIVTPIYKVTQGL